MRARLAALVAAVPLLAQTQATFYRAFEDGQNAEGGARWREALAAYRRAVELRPAPAARVLIYGNNLLEHYYPYARMARCLLELGDLDGAQAQLARSEAFGEPAPLREPLAKRAADLRTARKPKAPSPPPAQLPAPPVPAPAPETLPTTTPNPPAPRESTPAPAAAERPPSPSPKPDLTAAASAAVKPEPRTPSQTAPPPQAPPRPAPVPVPLPDTAPAPSSGWPRALGLGTLGAALVGLILWKRRGTGKDAPAFRDPQRVGPYRVERLLGRGGFASTYLARHETSEQKVALKLLHPHRLDDPEFLGRFRQEARLGALLVHPNLVRLVDPGPETGTPWLAMEFVSGLRLDQKLRTDGSPPLEELLGIALGVARGMAFAHAHGIVHRDLKPANIMLAQDGVKIMDFGISRIMDAETLTTTYAFLGTPLYAAPEAQLKTQVGPAADRYAFGVMLFEMLAGHPPFAGETPFEILDQHRSAPLPDLEPLRAEVPPALLRLTERLCRKQPDERPEDSEVIRILEDLAAPATPAPRD